jgi:vacuolar iron transporter family protein
MLPGEIIYISLLLFYLRKGLRMDAKTRQRFLDNWSDERNTAFLYHLISELEKDERLSEVYCRMEQIELRHAGHWEKLMQEGGETIPAFQPAARTRILAWLARRFGAAMILPSMQTMEQSGVKSYNQQAEGKGLAGDEAGHANVISQIMRTAIRGGMEGGMEGGTLAQVEGRHRATGGNALRAAVLGANDGMVSNLSLVMGVAGASPEGKAVLIAGIAGLLAGAISMALGEWLSVQSSRELYANQIKIETMEINRHPQEEIEELGLIYEARGLARDQALALANSIMANKESAIQTLAREELGINPDELGGSAWEAALTSFGLFAVGAIVPLFAFIIWTGMTAVWISIVMSAIGLFVLGAVVTLFTGQRVIFSGLRMVIFGLLAAAVTFGIGHVIGVSIGG